MSGDRLPAHLEVSAMIRAAEIMGGFAAVIKKGDREAGVILVLTIERGRTARLWERMPRLDGSRAFSLVRSQNIEKDTEFTEYLERRTARDADAWLVELDIPDAERFVAEFGR
jgi:hypothetical protein